MTPPESNNSKRSGSLDDRQWVGEGGDEERSDERDGEGPQATWHNSTLGFVLMTWPRSEIPLTNNERELLEQAARSLHAAVAEYERETSATSDRARIERVQLDLAAAEDRLWLLRSRLLNWTRPPWAPSASLVADWFSLEDSVYDEIGIR
jgi:hypothetical protein